MKIALWHFLLFAFKLVASLQRKLALKAMAILMLATLMLPQNMEVQAKAWKDHHFKKVQEQAASKPQAFLPPSANVNDFIRPEDGHWLHAGKTPNKAPKPAEATTETDELEPVTLIHLGKDHLGASGHTPKEATTRLDKKDLQLKAPINRLDNHLPVSADALEKAPEDGNKPNAAKEKPSNGLASTPLEALAKTHRALQEQELKNLWQATVQHNEVLRFSLEKLALPVDTQEAHSSYFMKKTLSSLISGSAIAASMLLNTGAYTNLGIMAGAQSIQNLVTGNTQPTEGALSATEQIQLAGLVDDLKLQLLGNYRLYSQELQHVAACHQKTTTLNETYAQALKKGDALLALTSGSTYYKALLEETQAKQQAKLAQLNLERLAGQESVAQLQLTLSGQQYQTLANQPSVSAPSTEADSQSQASEVPSLPNVLPSVANKTEENKKESPAKQDASANVLETALSENKADKEAPKPLNIAQSVAQKVSQKTESPLKLSNATTNAAVYSLVSQAKSPVAKVGHFTSRSSSFRSGKPKRSIATTANNAMPKGSEGPAGNNPLTLERFEDEL